MRQQGKRQSRGEDQEPVIQLTRGQMVGAVCALLVGALVFYLLGVVTSRFEPMLTANQAQQGNAQLLPAPDAPGTDASRDAPAREGRQTSPRRDALARKDKAVPPPTTQTDADARRPVPAGSDAAPLSRVPAPGENASAQPEMRTTVTDIPASSAADKESPASSRGPKPVNLPPAATSEKSTAPPPAPAPAPAAKEAAPEPPVQTAAAPDTAPPRDTAAPPVSIDKIELPPENLPPAAAAPAQTPFYSVQLIAFSSANRAKADAYAKEIRENAGLDVELEISTDGKLIRLYVGQYATRDDAVKACQELKKQERFSQAFVPQEARKPKN
ncbi:MAG TPA: SPOR domain-containing protein [Candidatus Hydrogenedentes bacterium]|nr:SPOR domain-containing protein [Candidatus Hydrogenedentota bacterium]